MSILGLLLLISMRFAIAQPMSKAQELILADKAGAYIGAVIMAKEMMEGPCKRYLVKHDSWPRDLSALKNPASSLSVAPRLQSFTACSASSALYREGVTIMRSSDAYGAHP